MLLVLCFSVLAPAARGLCSDRKPFEELNARKALSGATEAGEKLETTNEMGENVPPGLKPALVSVAFCGS